jgi:hypothetical protein
MIALSEPVAANACFTSASTPFSRLSHGWHRYGRGQDYAAGKGNGHANRVIEVGVAESVHLVMAVPFGVTSHHRPPKLFTP